LKVILQTYPEPDFAYVEFVDQIAFDKYPPVSLRLASNVTTSVEELKNPARDSQYDTFLPEELSTFSLLVENVRLRIARVFITFVPELADIDIVHASPRESI
jgi:hypothetical protein